MEKPLYGIMPRKIRSKPAEAYVPLEFDPGEAMQGDWGETTVLMDGRKKTVHIFCARLCFSAMPFVIAFPLERIEALLEGSIEVFKFFGGVPRHAIFGNMRTVVRDGWGKHVSSEQKDFVQLKAHYSFQSRFCNPGQANEGPRSYGDNTVSYQLEHYLPLLGKKPRAVWNAQPGKTRRAS